MSLLLLNIFTSLALLSSQAQSLGDYEVNICKSKKAQTVINDPAHHKNFNDLLELVDSHDILLFGEAHTALEGFHGKLIDFLSARLPEKSCLFYELNENIADIETYLKNKNGDHYRYVVIDLHKSAQRKKLKEYLVDSARQSDYEDNANKFETSKRDHVMSENISVAFKAKSCKKGIMFVGKEHLASNLGKGKENLKSRLQKKGLRVISFNLQDALDRTAWGRGKVISSWLNVCTKKEARLLPIPQKPFLIDATKLPSELLLYPHDSSKNSHWVDFDWILLAQ